MTNAIETTKRAYAQAMHDMTHHAMAAGLTTLAMVRLLEDAIEGHLEQRRQDHEALHLVARERFDSIQSLEQANAELVGRLGAMTGERDDIQGRLHAVDHAYSVQQQATGVAGGELRALQDQIGHLTRTRDLAERLAGYRLKQLDGTLQELSALRKSLTDTSASDSTGNVASAQADAKALMIVLSALVDSQRIVTDYLVPDGIRAKRAMEKLIPVLDNVELTKAQKVFERTKSVHEHNFKRSGWYLVCECGLNKPTVE